MVILVVLIDYVVSKSLLAFFVEDHSCYHIICLFVYERDRYGRKMVVAKHGSSCGGWFTPEVSLLHGRGLLKGIQQVGEVLVP